ncbi:VOC family protein [Flavobacterium restrictum]|uniref:Glyoxalase n=1 Tax=Flavobacterium restrictum TaxID=2594428 RepID=A0A553E0E7_9FLAO|nr:glyoxalase [Flavobacterium restrictum]TRX38333.1 glyoxalase [Flavobacterium restrictum]
MEFKPKSIRPFLGTINYDISRHFYRDLGFQEIPIRATMSYFNTEGFGFYLQDAYVKDWIDNTMVFMEVEDVTAFWNQLVALNLTATYKNVKIVPIVELDWGKECFLHDPAGNLWHFGEFYSK